MIKYIHCTVNVYRVVYIDLKATNAEPGFVSEGTESEK